VKDLVSIFKIRIELRQIGVRDESRVVGGAGVCGRSYCCNAVTDKLNPVSIKMAKEQNLSLNSMKISGPCGRLLCCLSYEYDQYREIKKDLPSEGAKIENGTNYLRVVEINIQSKRIKVQDHEGRYSDYPFDKFKKKDNNEWMLIQTKD
jgi:cell fate regulator YaaT (PSP1 superfamily)